MKIHFSLWLKKPAMPNSGTVEPKLKKLFVYLNKYIHICCNINDTYSYE
jgi:hypothetical protein